MRRDARQTGSSDRARRAIAVMFCAPLLLCCACNSVPARRQLDEAMTASTATSLASEAPPLPCPDGRCATGDCGEGGCPAPPVGCPPEPSPLPYSACCGCGSDDECICDGGDHGARATLDEAGLPEGIETEDTVAYYDSRCGGRMQPSNCVCIYAPRFASVRKVVNPILNEQIQAPGTLDKPLELVKYDELLEPTTTLQNIPAQVGIGRRKLVAIEGREAVDRVSLRLTPIVMSDALAPYENLSIIRHGVFEQGEKPYLAQSIQAAIVWSPTQGVQVLLDHQAANEVVGDQRVQATFTIKDKPCCPMLRVCKVASTPFANPGDTVDFTIRFDNVGNEPLRNVTIVDSLTTRLELVDGSAQSSVEADFASELNTAGSRTLRWDIRETIEPGDGGIVRFRAKVR